MDNSKYIKDFDAWNVQARIIENRSPVLYFHKREVWWCALGINIGHEQDGKNLQFERPILILKKVSPDRLLIAPLTSNMSSMADRIPVEIFQERNQILLPKYVS